MWFHQYDSTNHVEWIGQLNTATGGVTYYNPFTTAPPYVTIANLARGSDRQLYYAYRTTTGQYAGINRMTESGALTTYSPPSPAPGTGFSFLDLKANSAGTMWYVADTSNNNGISGYSVGTFSPTSTPVFADYPVSYSLNGSFYDDVVASNGNLWIAATDASQVPYFLQIAAGGAVTPVAAPAGFSAGGVGLLAGGPLFASGTSVYAVTTSGYSIQPGATGLGSPGTAIGSDNNLWYGGSDGSGHGKACRYSPTLENVVCYLLPSGVGGDAVADDAGRLFYGGGGYITEVDPSKIPQI
jgi:hypothetical protein